MIESNAASAAGMEKTMIQVGVADYGMNMWDGALYDYELRQMDLKTLGSRNLSGWKHSQLPTRFTWRRESTLWGWILHMPRRHAGNRDSMDAAFGKKYVWTSPTDKGKDFDTFCRQVNRQVEVCKRWNLKVGLHNHLGTQVETQEQLLAFLEACPECGLILDTGHLAVAEGGDPLYIAEHYFDRLVAVHVKEWVSTNPEAELWYERGYFCELGGGNIPIENEQVVKTLVKKGYEGWVFVEHDTHLRDPLEDLAVSREFLRRAGI